MDQIKLISVTFVLTLLIWATANQLVSETAEITVRILPEAAGNPGLIVRTDPPGLDHFQVALTGPKRLVDQIRDDARDDQLGPIRIPVPERANGQYTIDVRDALATVRDQLGGLSVERVTPGEVVIVVDHLQTVVMPLHLEGGLLQYEVPPQAEPDEVTVTMPETALAQMGNRRVPLNVEDLFRDSPAGEPQHRSGVPLPQKVAGADVRIEPPTVSVWATLRKQSKTATIPAVPITVQASIENFNRLEIETRDGRTLVAVAITVQGPPASVDGLVDGRTQVYGRVVLTEALVAQAGDFVELQPMFDLPPDVRLAAPVPPVEVRLRARGPQMGP